MQHVSINLNALSRYRISPNQYVILFLIHARQYAVMNQYGRDGPGFPEEDIADLLDRGFLINLNPVGRYFMDRLVLTDAVGADLFEPDREQAGLEFWNTYPIQLRDSRTGETFSLLTTDKQRFVRDYYVRVGFSAAKHQQVMDALYYAIDNQLIDMTIRDWLDSEQWMAVLQLKNRSELA